MGLAVFLALSTVSAGFVPELDAGGYSAGGTVTVRGSSATVRDDSGLSVSVNVRSPYRAGTFGGRGVLTTPTGGYMYFNVPGPTNQLYDSD